MRFSLDWRGFRATRVIPPFLGSRTSPRGVKTNALRIISVEATLASRSGNRAALALIFLGLGRVFPLIFPGVCGERLDYDSRFPFLGRGARLSFGPRAAPRLDEVTAKPRPPSQARWHRFPLIGWANERRGKNGGGTPRLHYRGLHL